MRRVHQTVRTPLPDFPDPLDRIANAVERLTDAMAAPPGVDLAAWVDSLSPIELGAEVEELLRKGARGNMWELALMVLRDWAAKA